MRSKKTSNDTDRQEWWRGAVIYQIYPRSFLDTNNDGIGDLKGICEKLEYVSSLGVDGIWLSPIFTSPMRDFGYDVANYCDIDPIFGDLKEFDRLVQKAHGLGLKIIIDQVYSHTSDQHAWFTESQNNKINPKADWYVWADPKPDGSPPNNWQSVFGGGAWTWDSRREQYYLHNFLTSQPDLNLHNRDVQDALLEVAKFWLDRGVDGFRLDAINFSMHDPDLRDNPPAPCHSKTFSRPFDLQQHLYNQSHPTIPKFLERLRKVTDGYDDIFTVAEVVGPNPLAEMKAFTEKNIRLNSAYSFDFLYADKLTTELFKSATIGWSGGSEEGWPAWAFSNHDAPRVISRWADDVDFGQAAKFYAMLLISLRGNIFLYQGEELGLPQAHVTFEQLKDPEAIANWPQILGRDGARTPMPWKSYEINAGFSAEKPWLPVDNIHKDIAIDVQDKDQNSTLNAIRKLIAIRASSSALRLGAIEFMDSPSEVLAFKRRTKSEECICVFNLGSNTTSWSIPHSHDYRIIASTGVIDQGNQLATLSGYIAQKFD